MQFLTKTEVEISRLVQSQIWRIDVIKVGIIGATGYTGIELLRLLCPRDDVNVVLVTSREQAGTSIEQFFPSLRGHLDLCFTDPKDADFSVCDVVFYATPHGVAMNSAADVLSTGAKVIDLSADFRIKDVRLWQDWYNKEHTAPQLVEEAVYGLPEVNRAAIAEANLVAVPGCYPTAIQLGFLPLIEAGLVDTRRLIADAKSGVSGAERKTAEEYLRCETTESIRAYALA
ncbi:MAG: N-acetyl-gamma-glutamyl-phosphate reductase, partial [Pseudohongiellaceae bacterium]